MNDTYRCFHNKAIKTTPKTLDEIFETQAANIFEMEDSELSCLLARAELLCRWLRGALHLKSNEWEENDVQNKNSTAPTKHLSGETP